MKRRMFYFWCLVFCLSCVTKGYVWDEGLRNVSDYYGTDLTIFPPKIRTWIMDIAFPKSKMERDHMLDSKLKAWWSDDGNTVLFEASYIIAQDYVGEGKIQTWGQGASYSGSPKIFEMYGEYAKFQTLKFKWDLKQEVENLLESDPMFVEVIEFAKQLCDEIEYNWAEFSGYKGSSVKRTPGKRYAVCSGYADEVMEKALNLDSVQSVQRWVGPSHAWNVLILIDGRKLLFDLTWFDNEHINEKTGEIYQTDDYGWANITFDEELFKFSGIGYGSGVFTHNFGEFVSEITK